MRTEHPEQHPPVFFFTRTEGGFKSPGVSGDILEITAAQTATESSPALCVVCGFVGVAQFTVQGPNTPLASPVESYGPLDRTCNQYTPLHPKTHH